MVAKTSSQRDDTLKSGRPDRFKGQPRSPARFKEREVARAVRAAKRAGGVKRVELALDGHINIILEGPATQAGNELEEWMKKHAHQTQRR
jgi:hypothetical protein